MKNEKLNLKIQKLREVISKMNSDIISLVTASAEIEYKAGKLMSEVNNNDKNENGLIMLEKEIDKLLNNY